MARTNIRNKARELEMCQLFKSGKTLQQIGDSYGLSRERVRRLIKRNGMCWLDGGKHLEAEARRLEREKILAERREARSIKTYGCSHAEVEQINQGMALTDIGSPAYMYFRDSMNAKKRGLRFDITLPQWMDLFDIGGGLSNRCREQDGLVLGRIDKSGHYTIDNVRVVTLAENSRDTRMQTMHRESFNAA